MPSSKEGLIKVELSIKEDLQPRQTGIKTPLSILCLILCFLQTRTVNCLLNLPHRKPSWDQGGVSKTKAQN